MLSEVGSMSPRPLGSFSSLSLIYQPVSGTIFGYWLSNVLDGHQFFSRNSLSDKSPVHWKDSECHYFLSILPPHCSMLFYCASNIPHGLKREIDKTFVKFIPVPTYPKTKHALGKTMLATSGHNPWNMQTSLSTPSH